MTRVFVAGGAGGVGEGVVRAWLAEGATVVTASRSAERRARLRDTTAELPGTLVVLDGAASDPELVSRARAEHGPFDHAVASVGGGGWKLAPLTVIDEPMFRRVVEDGITAHWLVARTLVPGLPRTGSYVLVNGGAALEVVPGTGPLSLVARAQLAMADILRAEAGEDGPRVTSLILGTPIATRDRGARIRPEWLRSDDVGTACVRLARSGAPPRELVLNDRAELDRIG
jgi:NAD(P)-dependent dehydrogenase (short-subunit alcohol dehydrogenase family)